MMDRHCVNKMSVIVLLQPMDCQRAVYVHGRAAGIKSDESSRRLSTTLNFTLLNKGRSKMKDEERLQEENGNRTVDFFGHTIEP